MVGAVLLDSQEVMLLRTALWVWVVGLNPGGGLMHVCMVGRTARASMSTVSGGGVGHSGAKEVVEGCSLHPELGEYAFSCYGTVLSVASSVHNPPSHPACGLVDTAVCGCQDASAVCVLLVL